MVDFESGYPMLIVGDAILDFKKQHSGPIVTVKDISELKEAVAYYSGLNKLDRVLVIEDISFLGKDANTTLLKFVEEIRIPLVLLSRYDKVDEVLISRIKKIVKYYKDPTESKFLTVTDANQKIEDLLSPDSHYFDKVRYMAKLSPKLIMIDKAIRVSRIKSKIFSFID